MSEWCEHWTIRNNQYYSPSIAIGEDWKFCPICAAPRPECKKKPLYLKLAEAYYGKDDLDVTNFETYKREAQAALTHFSEIVDEIKYDGFTTFDNYQKLIKRKFAESLEMV